MCSYFIVGNKIFCFFKKWLFAFSHKDIFQGGEEGGWSQVPPKIEGGLLLKGGMTDLDFFGGWGGGSG